MQTIYRRWLNLIKTVQFPAVDYALQINKQHTFIDVGCATGRQFIRIAKQAKSAVGVDINPESLRAARQLISDELSTNIQLCQSTAERLPFVSGSVDRILLSDVLSVVEDPVLTLKEALRVLSNNGRIVIVNGRGYNTISRFYNTDRYCLKQLRRVLCKVTALPSNLMEFYSKRMTMNYERLSSELRNRYADIDEFLMTTIKNADGKVCSHSFTFNDVNEFLLSVIYLIGCALNVPVRLLNYIIYPLTPLFLFSERLFPARAGSLSAVVVVGRR